MAKKHRPRHGSLGVRPRKRAKSQSPRISSWPSIQEKGLLGFAGYKAGMTHVVMIDDTPGSPTKGHEISVPVTVLETPPMFIYGIRAYQETPYGRKVLTDAIVKIDEKVRKKLRLNKKPNKEDALKKIEENMDKVCDVRVLAYTMPWMTGFGKKKPERMEIALGGKDVKEKLEYAKEIVGKKLKISDVIRDGEYVDTISVTKGKGWQGPVKRFGVGTQRRKATGRIRHVGTLGPWHPARVMYTIPQAGQMGYHKRTELNKRVLLVSNGNEPLNVKGGFIGYGILKNDFLLIKGSVGGPRKRLIKIRKSMRVKGPVIKPQIKHISTESKQGV